MTMKHPAALLVVSVLLLLHGLPPLIPAALAQTTRQTDPLQEGEAIFGQRCAVCHTIGRGNSVGPDLDGVTKRREESWLRIQIQSPSVHRADNDPISKANLEKFGMAMPDLGLAKEQVEGVIAYLKTAGKPPAAIPAQYAPTLTIGVLAVVALTAIGLIAGRKRVEVRP